MSNLIGTGCMISSEVILLVPVVLSDTSLCVYLSYELTAKLLDFAPRMNIAEVRLYFASRISDVAYIMSVYEVKTSRD